jgi:hypothetical protein
MGKTLELNSSTVKTAQFDNRSNTATIGYVAGKKNKSKINIYEHKMNQMQFENFSRNKSSIGKYV